jgi:uncharacterized protein (UPF0335 family)
MWQAARTTIPKGKYMTTIAIQTTEGTVNVNAELLRTYYTEASELLKNEADAKEQFKDAIEAQAEALGVDKKVLTKYFKARFKEATKEASQQGKVFEQLDEAFE